MSPINVSLSTAADALWKECHALNHEMILTTNGRRIFPTLEFSINGLNPLKMYTMSIQMEFVDDKQLRFFKGKWIESISLKIKEPSRKVYHQHGVQSGENWMKTLVNFNQVRITNQKSKEQSNPSFVHLLANHRYLPVLTIYEEGEIVHTVSIPHTQFMCVTTYHGEALNKLKTNANPYATGARKDRPRRQVKAANALISPLNQLIIPGLDLSFLQMLMASQQVSPISSPLSPPSEVFETTSTASLSPSSLSPVVKSEVLENAPVCSTSPSLPTLAPMQTLLSPFFPLGIPAFNPFLNPLFNPFASIFPTPSVSPSNDEVQLKTEQIDDDIPIDVVS